MMQRWYCCLASHSANARQTRCLCVHPYSADGETETQFLPETVLCPILCAELCWNSDQPVAMLAEHMTHPLRRGWEVLTVARGAGAGHGEQSPASVGGLPVGDKSGRQGILSATVCPAEEQESRVGPDCSFLGSSAYSSSLASA